MKKETIDNLLLLVREGYDNIAPKFDLTRKKNLWPELSRLAEAVKDGDRVLDAGCGNGRLLKAFVDKKIEYLGFDSSQKLIAIAQQNYPDREFIVRDVLKKDERLAGKFDYIFCIAVLAHIPSGKLQRQALENLHGYLRPGGRLIVSVWNLRRQPRFKVMMVKNFFLRLLGRRSLPAADLIFPWQDKNQVKRYYHAFSGRELKSLAENSSLEIEKIYRDKHNYWLILK